MRVAHRRLGQQLKKLCTIVLANITFFSAFIPASAAAVVTQGTVVATATQMDTVIKIFGALIFVVVVILIASFIIKKTNALGQGSHQAIQILATTAIGTKERLMLIQCGEKQMLLGSTAQQVTLLQSFEEPIYEPTTHRIKRDLSHRLQKKMSGLGLNQGSNQNG